MAATAVSPTEVGDANDLQHHEIVAYLSNCTAEEQQRFFKHQYVGRSEPVQFIARPELCQLLPEFAQDITNAYLKHATFTAKVWVNYDAACKKFYVDDRKASCGKLVLSPTDRKHVKGLQRQGVQLHRVRFDVGTPFTTLAVIDFRIVQSTIQPGSEVSARLREWNSEHPDLARFINILVGKLDGYQLSEREDSFGMEDLKSMAKAFMRKPTETEAYQKCYIPDMPSVWMDIDDPYEHNPGYVDVDTREMNGFAQYHGGFLRLGTFGTRFSDHSHDARNHIMADLQGSWGEVKNVHYINDGRNGWSGS